MLQCVAMCCSVLQCVAVCCSIGVTVLQCAMMFGSAYIAQYSTPATNLLWVAECCSVLQFVAVCCITKFAMHSISSKNLRGHIDRASQKNLRGHVDRDKIRYTALIQNECTY